MTQPLLNNICAVFPTLTPLNGRLLAARKKTNRKIYGTRPALIDPHENLFTFSP
jgi:hypothetical protein